MLHFVAMCSCCCCLQLVAVATRSGYASVHLFAWAAPGYINDMPFTNSICDCSLHFSQLNMREIVGQSRRDSRRPVALCDDKQLTYREKVSGNETTHTEGGSKKSSALQLHVKGRDVSWRGGGVAASKDCPVWRRWCRAGGRGV